MRDIKFRAWNKTKGLRTDIKMYDVEDIVWYEEDCVLMQYTGLKDKNGQEIYEGDIVEYLGYDRKNDYPTGKRVKTRIVVQYDELYTRFNIGGLLQSIFEDNTCEVIGNIYENPDLLDK